MYNGSHPKSGGDNYDRFVGTGPDTADPLTGGAGIDGGAFGTTEDWSSWGGSTESAFGTNASPEEVDNTAFGRIDIPV